MKTEEASRGTRIGMGQPDTDDQGYALDDPPTEAMYKCDWCEKEDIPESEMIILGGNDMCLECAG